MEHQGRREAAFFFGGVLPWSILMGLNRHRCFGHILGHPFSLLKGVRYRSAAGLFYPAKRLLGFHARGNEQRPDDDRGSADTRAAVDRHVLPRLQRCIQSAEKT
jgi:hypothetical protein